MWWVFEAVYSFFDELFTGKHRTWASLFLTVVVPLLIGLLVWLLLR